jgi:hypothetical protein
MKKFGFFAMLLLFSLQSAFSQVPRGDGYKPSLLNHNIDFSNYKNLSSPLKTQDFDLNSITMIFVCVINPVLMYENKKINFGLTKEVSIGFPFLNSKYFGTIGKLGLEYSYIFREERNYHLRCSFSSEIPIQSSDYAAVTLGFGGGYFTDFKKKGIFPQVSLSMIIPIDEQIAAYPYIKLRHTFMLDKTQTDNTDISIGVGFMFFALFN